MARRPPPGAPVLTRRYGVLDQLPRLYVVCEGGTEKRCIDELRAHWRIPSLQVEVVGQGGDPSAVVRKAKDKRAASGGRRRRKPDVEIWVAFDRDAHERWPGAIQQAMDLGFELARSNPCIELWGLLLHRDQNAWIDRHEAQRQLASLHPGYHHDRHPYFALDVVLAGMEDAHRRAEQMGQRAEQDGEPYKNPTTRFPGLVERVRGLAM